jgi:hypothetical protein
MERKKKKKVSLQGLHGNKKLFLPPPQPFFYNFFGGMFFPEKNLSPKFIEK